MLPFAPDLAVEVISPNDSFTAVESKAFAWLDAGTMVVLLLEPDSKTVHVYHSRSDIAIYQMGEMVDMSDVVKGWRFSVDEIFP